MQTYSASTIEREFAENLQILANISEKSVAVRLLCAFSGGVDSLALLILATKTFGSKNTVPLYVNHNLRDKDELEKEIFLNKHNCAKLGLDLKIETITDGQIQKNSKKYGGTEASARYYRYSLLKQIALQNECTYIITAHHYDDQLETVLMKIVSRAPITALRGISEKTDNVIRPLITFRKKQLEFYVKHCGFEWSTDSTNSDNSIKRNEIRNIVIPELQKIMPDWESRITNISKIAREQCCGICTFKDRVPVNLLKNFSYAKKIMALFSMWDNTVGTQMPQTLIKRVVDNLDNNFCVISANGGTFCIYNGIIYLINDKERKMYEQFSQKIEPSQNVIPLLNNSYIEISDKGTEKNIKLNPEKFEGTPVVRYVRQGDSINLKDGKKNVLRLLQSKKVPPILRHRIPVIADDKEICAVFCSGFGLHDRICVKMRSTLAPFMLCSYIYKESAEKV